MQLFLEPNDPGSVQFVGFGVCGPMGAENEEGNSCG